MLSKFEVNPTRRVHVTQTPIKLQPRWFPCAMKTPCKSPRMVFRTCQASATPWISCLDSLFLVHYAPAPRDSMSQANTKLIPAFVFAPAVLWI